MSFFTQQSTTDTTEEQALFMFPTYQNDESIRFILYPSSYTGDYLMKYTETRLGKDKFLFV